MKETQYFRHVRRRPDRLLIEDAWIQRIINDPEKKTVQEDGRIRLWGRVPEANDKYLRVVLLDDGETVHNAFFDRRFQRGDP